MHEEPRLAFYQNASNRRARAIRGRPPRRPHIEMLEHRCLLAQDVAGISDGIHDHWHDSATAHYLPPHAFHSSTDQLLSAPSNASPREIALDYLRSNAADFGIQETDLQHYRVTDEYVSQHTGVTHLYLRQLHNGLDVIHADININITEDGRVLTVGSSFLTGLNVAQAPMLGETEAAPRRVPAIGPNAALSSLAAHLDWRIAPSSQLSTASTTSASDTTRAVAPLPMTTFPGGGGLATVLPNRGVSLESIPVQLRYVPLPSGGVELAWGLVVQTVDGRHWYDASISAVDGDLLHLADWASHATYNVYDLPLQSPAEGERSLRTDVADPTASPLGWHDIDSRDGFGEFTTTRGNNVNAQEDRDATNEPGFQPDGNDTLLFDFPVDLMERPINSQSAAITNLFYHVNVLHDIHYLYGFDEAAGNFQDTNLSGLGIGNDAIQADAQDGFDFNNAAFFVTPDGIAPRIQMAEWIGDTTLVVNSPLDLVADFNAGPAVFGAQLDAMGTQGDLVISSPVDGCLPLGNPDQISGNVALIERGTCFFTEKVRHAQDAGAIGVVITNNEPDGVVTMAGDAEDILIPALMVSLDEGNSLRAALDSGQVVNVKLAGSPNRDSSFDNGVIIHEYGHGVSTRLAGGPSNASALNGLQGSGLGEGWSDWWALMFTQTSDDAQMDSFPIGAYLAGESSNSGIRRFPYSFDMSVNPLTLDDIDESQADVPCPSGCDEEHNTGEVWASALWDLNWLLIDGDGGSIPAQGFDADLYHGSGGNNLALQLVIDGIKLLPSNPTFLDGRDAILAADLALTDGANQLAIWTAFARRGMGFSATVTDSIDLVSVTEAFDLPNLASDAEWVGDANSGASGDGVHWNDANNWIVDGDVDVLPSTRPPGSDITLRSAPTVGPIDLGTDRIANSITFAADYTLAGGALLMSNGQIDVHESVVATLDADLISGDVVAKVGEGTLVIRGNAPDIVVDGGTVIVASSASIQNLTIQPGATAVVHGAVAGDTVNRGQLLAAGDFDGNGALTATDIDAMYSQLNSNFFDPRFDLVADGVIDVLDLEDLLSQRIGTIRGDADVNGIVDGVDFDIWRANRFTVNLAWSTGDFNGDGVTDGSDFNIWNVNRFRAAALAPGSSEVHIERTPRAAAVGQSEFAPRNMRRQVEVLRRRGSAGVSFLKSEHLDELKTEV